MQVRLAERMIMAKVSRKSLTGYPFGRELGLISNSVSFGGEGHHGRVNDIGVGGAAG